MRGGVFLGQCWKPTGSSLGGEGLKEKVCAWGFRVRIPPKGSLKAGEGVSSLLVHVRGVLTLGKSPLAKTISREVFPQPPSPTMTALISAPVASVVPAV